MSRHMKYKLRNSNTYLTIIPEAESKENGGKKILKEKLPPCQRCVLIFRMKGTTKHWVGRTKNIYPKKNCEILEHLGKGKNYKASGEKKRLTTKKREPDCTDFSSTTLGISS